jgi:hypothetical protein
LLRRCWLGCLQESGWLGLLGPLARSPCHHKLHPWPLRSLQPSHECSAPLPAACAEMTGRCVSKVATGVGRLFKTTAEISICIQLAVEDWVAAHARVRGCRTAGVTSAVCHTTGCGPVSRCSFMPIDTLACTNAIT